MSGTGGFAAIHAGRARQYKGELDRIKGELDRIAALLDAGGFVEGETTVERVEALCVELVRLRREAADREWEAAAP